MTLQHVLQSNLSAAGYTRCWPQQKDNKHQRTVFQLHCLNKKHNKVKFVIKYDIAFLISIPLSSNCFHSSFYDSRTYLIHPNFWYNLDNKFAVNIIYVRLCSKLSYLYGTNQLEYWKWTQSLSHIQTFLPVIYICKSLHAERKGITIITIVFSSGSDITDGMMAWSWWLVSVCKGQVDWSVHE